MTTRKPLLHRTKVPFKLVCFFFCAYYLIKETLRYYENKDTSVIVFRRFNERPEDKYPTFTFCVYNNSRMIYSDVFNELRMSKEEYSNLLKGGISSSNKTADTFKTLYQLDHEMITMDPYKLFQHVEFKTNDASNNFLYLSLIHI